VAPAIFTPSRRHWYVIPLTSGVLRVTDSPLQKETEPEAEIKAVGFGINVTGISELVLEQPVLELTTTDNLPELDAIKDWPVAFEIGTPEFSHRYVRPLPAGAVKVTLLP